MLPGYDKSASVNGGGRGDYKIARPGTYVMVVRGIKQRVVREQPHYVIDLEEVPPEEEDRRGQTWALWFLWDKAERNFSTVDAQKYHSRARWNRFLKACEIPEEKAQLQIADILNQVLRIDVVAAIDKDTQQQRFNRDGSAKLWLRDMHPASAADRRAAVDYLRAEYKDEAEG